MAAKRMLVTLDEETFDFVKSLAKKKKKSLANIARTFIENGLSDEEDMYYSKVADERLSGDPKWLDHKDAWK